MDIDSNSAPLLVEQFLATIPEYPAGKYSGRGIICSAGRVPYQTCAYVLFNLLRELGCTLPIISYYLGESERDRQWERLVEPLGVEVVNLKDFQRQYPHRRLNGWESKVYGMLHCPFEEVLLLDADIVPVRDPTFLFDSPEFRGSGAVLWPDFPTEFTPECFRVFGLADKIPPRRLRPVESGQVLCNKRKCWREINLTNFYNDRSEFYYNYVYGDKDTFLMAWLKAGTEPPRPRDCLRDDKNWCFIQHWFDEKPIFWHVANNARKLVPYESGEFMSAEFPHRERVLELLQDLGRRWGTAPPELTLISDEGQPMHEPRTEDARIPFLRRHVPTRHPHAFNAALSVDGSQRLLVYRSDEQRLAACLLAEDDTVIAGSETEFDISHNVDPRLVRHKAQLYMSTSYYGYGMDCERVELWPLEFNGTTLRLRRSERIAFEGVMDDPMYVRQREKNWAPWVWNESLFYTQRISPHRICEVDFDSQCARLRFETEWKADSWRTEWGSEFRGNAPPVRLPDGRFLSTFHTQGSDGYYSGFLTFDAAPPFHVRQISREPFLRPEDSTGRNWRSGKACVFILSMQLEQERIRLCGGDNDHSIVLLECGLDDVLRSLVCVQSVTRPAQSSTGNARHFTVRKDPHDLLIMNEVYFQNEYHLPERLDGKVVVDIGAHIGAFSCRCLDRGAARVICIEPGESSFQVLQKNLSHYGSRAIAHHKAAGPSNGEASISFCEYSNSHGQNTSVLNRGKPVPAIGLDQIIAEHGPVDILKLDCEGMEYPILYSSKQLDTIPVIVGEYHDLRNEAALNPGLSKLGPFTKEGLVNYLSNRGYHLRFFQDWGDRGIFMAQRTV